MRLRALAATVLALHGVIHLIGFVVPWRIAQVEGFAYKTTALGGSVSLGETGALVLGVAWLALAIGFVVAAVGVWRARPWALSLTAALAVGSLVACVLGLPEAIAGIVVNVGILGAVAWAGYRGRSQASVAG